MKKVILIICIAAFVSCQQAAVVITDADKEDIRTNLANFAEGVRTSTDSFADGYAENIISFPPHDKMVSGKQNVIAFHTDPNGPVATDFSIDTKEVEGVDDLAYAWGTWSFNGLLADTIQISDMGKFMVIMKKQADNSWKTTREIWNSDLPMN